jgi:nitroreductase
MLRSLRDSRGPRRHENAARSILDPAQTGLLMRTYDSLRAKAKKGKQYVADFSRMSGASTDERGFLAAADIGAIAQDVYLFCAAAGLATVVRGLVERKKLSAAMGLGVDERIMLT